MAEDGLEGFRKHFEGKKLRTKVVLEVPGKGKSDYHKAETLSDDPLRPATLNVEDSQGNKGKLDRAHTTIAKKLITPTSEIE